MKAQRRPRLRPQHLLFLALVLLVLAVYAGIGGHDFINYDDREYVVENPFVSRGLTGDGIARAFTSAYAANWHPLTWLSHMLDVRLFGLDAGWHHRMSLLLHVLGTAALFGALRQLTGALWRSALVAALFGVHPLHVESVAWIAERKDVLSGLFWSLTLLAYARYVHRPGGKRYLVVVALFAIGLMAKPMVVTLPFALLVLDWWPLGRLAAAPGTAVPSGPAPARQWLLLAREKLPLLALAAASSAITYRAQAGALVPHEIIPFGARVAVALVSYAAYLGKTVWPRALGVFYPHPATLDAGVPAAAAASSLLL
ncbi:MAG TPA: glycosyltransferase family 39 protein, partial [Candidatus Methanoperedens sp.]|nr:glycosyltransferase family 39 protein [Candidatus Methanoperedens sp.]